MSNLGIEKSQSEVTGPAARKSINISTQELVKVDRLAEGQSLPICFSPAFDGVDLAAWARNQTALIENYLSEYGAILFRGFGLAGQQDLEQFVNAISLELMPYMEGATPRKRLGDNIYTATEFPAEHTIAVHNELSYVMTWPLKICFFCLKPAEKGGETPICDVRKVLPRIDHAIRQRFIKHGWMLVRNFSEGLGLPWQTVFHTNDKAQVERYCREARISYQWKGNNHLSTRQLRPAVAVHPKTGNAVWFNHIAFWHISSLPPDVRQVLLINFRDDELPFNTYYGDGSVIEDQVIDELRQAYDSETVCFAWEKGDLLLLDNMLVAHGRNPYSGDRRILVSMGEPYTRNDF
jgi:alpha-ketoglutarate-dependent taurine dioxygenase